MIEVGYFIFVVLCNIFLCITLILLTKKYKNLSKDYRELLDRYYTLKSCHPIH